MKLKHFLLLLVTIVTLTACSPLDGVVTYGTYPYYSNYSVMRYYYTRPNYHITYTPAPRPPRHNDIHPYSPRTNNHGKFRGGRR